MHLHLVLFSFKDETFAEDILFFFEDILIKNSLGSEAKFIFQSDCGGFLTSC